MKKILWVTCMLIVTTVSAQRFDVLSGELKNAKGITEYNVTFDYSELTVHGYSTEEAYLQDKMTKRNQIEGKAEKFRKDWFTYRDSLYEPAFIAYFNEKFDKGEIKASKNVDAKYTMDVKTTWIYPSYNAGTAIEPAKISAMITIKESSQPSNILVAIKFDKSIGLEHELSDVSLGDRVAWAYEKLARNMAMQLKRFL